MESLSVFKMDNNIQPDYSGAYAKIYEKATPESGTGKYYKEGKPTAQQLKAREKYSKIKDLTNKGKHKEASALYAHQGVTTKRKSSVDESKKAKYDNRYSDNTGEESAKKKAALEKKRGMKLDNHPQFKREEVEQVGRYRKWYEEYKAELNEGYSKKFEAWVNQLVEEGYDIERWADNIDELVETYINEHSLWDSRESIVDALLDENSKMADKAYARAKELGQKRRNSREHKQHGSSVGKNERAAYNLSQAATDRNKSLETQGGNQTGGGSKPFGYASHKSNPVKSKSTGDTGAEGHRRKRDEKKTHGKKGQPLKSPKYKLSWSQRLDHHSSRRQELKDPKKNPKHEANKK